MVKEFNQLLETMRDEQDFIWNEEEEQEVCLEMDEVLKWGFLDE